MVPAGALSEAASASDGERSDTLPIETGAERVAIALMGPTAAGKTEAAVRLAGRFAVDLINVDAVQVYRGLDVGTAKPSATLRARFPHALVDIRDPGDPYSAGDFVRDAVHEMRRAWARGRVPLLVGGTMFYFAALERGLAPLPAADPTLRAALDAEGQERGWPALHERLRGVDPQAAARIAPRDRQRIQRALEIYHLTGRPAADAMRGVRNPGIGFRLIKIALVPSDRQRLHGQVETRFHEMLERGLVAETRGLLAAGFLPVGTPAQRAVGYRQVVEYLQVRTGYDEMVAAAIAATRQLAKRQITWLRSMRGTVWFDSLAPHRDDTLTEYLRNKNGRGRL